MNQDFLNWQEAIHMLPLSDGVCTGKGRGRWRLVDLACPDKNIVWWALLSVFRACDGHSSTPVRPPWQWLALSSSFPGPLCRWPACWRCQHKSGCSFSHNHSLASALIGPLYFHKKYSRNISMPLLCSFIIKKRLASARALMDVSVVLVTQLWHLCWVTRIGMANIWSF